jgi:hypothetical protein
MTDRFLEIVSREIFAITLKIPPLKLEELKPLHAITPVTTSEMNVRRREARNLTGRHEISGNPLGLTRLSCSLDDCTLASLRSLYQAGIFVLDRKFLTQTT